MDIEDLTVLIEVAQLGSFAAVARKRNIDPSSVSRIVAGIERQLKVRLFQRSTRKLSLTEAGERYVANIAPLVEGLDQANLHIREAGGEAAGTLRMTCSVAFGVAVLTPLVRDFKRCYPKVTLDLIMTDDNIDLVESSIDLAIRLSPEQNAEYVGHKLMSTEYRVCVDPEFMNTVALLSPECLATCECVTFALPPYRSRWLFKNEVGNVQEVPITPSISTSNALAVKQFVLDGLGPGLLPTWLVKPELAEGRLVALFDDHDVTATDFSTAAWLLYPSRHYVPSKTRVMIDFLKERLADG